MRSHTAQVTVKEDFSALEEDRDLDGQQKCKGCNQIKMLLEVMTLRERRGDPALPPKAVVFHASYAELDRCARDCVTCRVFRQALLLNEITSEDAANLIEIRGPVSARLVRLTHRLAIRVSIGDADAPVKTAVVHCDNSSRLAIQNLSADPNSHTIYDQAKRWLDECIHNHVECGNYAFSGQNPTRLLRIISESEVVLVESPQGEGQRLRYSALSYVWGGPAQSKGLPQGKPTSSNINPRLIGNTTRSNLEDRLRPFPISLLPATIQDAIQITSRLDNPQRGIGVQHIWVDAVCIIQDDPVDKANEIHRMQEVYGNALVTLCASSTRKATEPLLQARLAWTMPSKPCRINGTWLAPQPADLASARLGAPISRRAWTLQEEHLSPRLLYWGGQRLHWACPRARLSEWDSSLDTMVRDLTSAPMISPQSFLAACRASTPRELHIAWQDLVTSYTERHVTDPSDRFSALAGLAAKYCAARRGDTYLAGLWQTTLAQNLTWAVRRPAEARNSLKEHIGAPSWSWASLPLGSAVWMVHTFKLPKDFELVMDPVEGGGKELRRPEEIVARGEEVTKIRVRGRLKRFWNKGAIFKPWGKILRRVEGMEMFSFADDPSQDTYTVDLETGRVLSYEAGRREVLGQLDYNDHAIWIGNGGQEIYCLQVNEAGMMLLESAEQPGAYRRIGVAHGYPINFFDRAEMVELNLV